MKSSICSFWSKLKSYFFCGGKQLITIPALIRRQHRKHDSQARIKLKMLPE